MIVNMDIIQLLGFGKLYNDLSSIFSVAFAWFPYWAPIVLGYFFWHEWLHYVQAQWRANIKWVMLEVKVPKEITKSPVAMEIFLNCFHQFARGKWYDWYWKGRVRNWFSLELVSLEGHIKFFVRTNALYKNFIEAQLYAQYPDIEVYEVPDYTRYVDYRGKEGDWKMVGVDFKLAKDDPYPIKTYVDYGLDKEGIKEEHKVDPITSVIEYLGSIGKGEQIWVQILIQFADKRYKKEDGTMGDWKAQAKDVLAKLKEGEKKEEKDVGFKMLMKTKGELDVIAAIERSVGKQGFDCGIRALYLAKKDKFTPSVSAVLAGVFRPFGDENLNSFGVRDHTLGFDFWWQDYKDYRITKKRVKQFDAYKHRSWFYLPYKFKPFVLTTEELATIYHFPGGVAQTPTFGRIPSRKSEAPVNLPI